MKIIGAHVLATILAAFALKFHDSWVLCFLFAELLLLAIGFRVHLKLHNNHYVRRWAMTRLVAEIARSVSSIGKLHLQLDYLFWLPFPTKLRSLLHTINVLHLQSTYGNRATAWANPIKENGVVVVDDDPAKESVKQFGKKYVDKRLKNEGQISYNQRTYDDSSWRMKRARRVFYSTSGAAIIATLTKFSLLAFAHSQHDNEFLVSLLEGIASYVGIFAVILPVIAVAVLSLSAAFDHEAREQIAEEMLEFLIPQANWLENATSTREFAQLLLETEARLLGETVSWYSRRSFLGVS